MSLPDSRGVLPGQLVTDRADGERVEHVDQPVSVIQEAERVLHLRALVDLASSVEQVDQGAARTLT